jgi:hypothetical protein
MDVYWQWLVTTAEEQRDKYDFCAHIRERSRKA